MSADTATLYTEAKCFSCYGITSAQALILALLREWLLALDASADVDPNSLLAEGKCLPSCASASLYQTFFIILLDKIKTAYGG